MTDEERFLKQGKCPSCFGFKKRKYQGEKADYDCFMCNGTGKASEYLKHKRNSEKIKTAEDLVLFALSMGKWIIPHNFQNFWEKLYSKIDLS